MSTQNTHDVLVSVPHVVRFQLTHPEHGNLSFDLSEEEARATAWLLNQGADIAKLTASAHAEFLKTAPELPQ